MRHIQHRYQGQMRPLMSELLTNHSATKQEHKNWMA